MTIRWHAIELDANTIDQWCLQTPCGQLIVSTQKGIITGIAWTEGQTSLTSNLGQPLRKKLLDYFHNPNVWIDWDLAIQGTDFQKRVWQAMLEIPLGRTVAYGELARQLGSSPRAIAQACRRNPYPIVIPCHRVIGRRGLGGYCGETSGTFPAIKHWLLRHEGWRGC